MSNYTETLQELFDREGGDGLIRFFVNTEGLTKEQADDKVSYCFDEVSLLSQGRPLVIKDNIVPGAIVIPEPEVMNTDDRLAEMLHNEGYTGIVPLHTAALIESLQSDIQENQKHMNHGLVYESDIPRMSDYIPAKDIADDELEKRASAQGRIVLRSDNSANKAVATRTLDYRPFWDRLKFWKH